MQRNLESASEGSDYKQISYLKLHFQCLREPTKLVGGIVNDMWEVITPEGIIIARFYPAFFQKKFAHEVWILRECEKFNFPTPRIILAEKNEYETPVIVYRKIEGDNLQNCLTSLASEDIVSILLSVSTLFIKAAELISISHVGYLHETSYKGTVQQYLFYSMDHFCHIIHQASLLERQTIAYSWSLFNQMLDNLDISNPQVTYNDFSLKNILVSSRKLSGIIDWEFISGAHFYLAHGNLVLKNRLESSWPVISDFLGYFSREEQRLIRIFGVYRGFELLSYMPTTVLYPNLGKRQAKVSFLQSSIISILRDLNYSR